MRSLGKISDIVIDSTTGKIAYAVVSFGGLLEVGTKLFVMPWQAFHWSADKNYFILDLAEATLESSPGFDKQQWPDSSNDFLISKMLQLNGGQLLLPSGEGWDEGI